jgi:hypothetical protein
MKEPLTKQKHTHQTHTHQHIKYRRQTNKRTHREVGLRERVVCLGDDLDCLLVGADGAVRAHAPEEALVRALRQRVDVGADCLCFVFCIVLFVVSC